MQKVTIEVPDGHTVKIVKDETNVSDTAKVTPPQ